MTPPRDNTVTALANMRDAARRARPTALFGWLGWSIAGRHVNPYLPFVESYARGRSPEERIANLLIGDLFTDALLHVDLKVYPDGLDAKPPTWIRPHRSIA